MNLANERAMWIAGCMLRLMMMFGLCVVSVGTVKAHVGDVTGDRPNVLFIGNSITAGWSLHFPTLFTDERWLNRGIGGQTTSELLERFERELLAANPDVIVVMGGTNDIAGLGGPTTVDAIFANIAQMVWLAQKYRVAVVLCSVLPAHEFYCCPDVHPVPLIRALNRKLRRFARRNSLVFADYYSLMVDRRKGIGKAWSDDGVHPNKLGYARMLPLTQDAILKALKYGKEIK